ncbi:MAG TPA: hypothetical protein PKA58_37025 [Polyangium sp.]|nr:hypothetical protein [Polyangium sp.]
MAGETPAGSSDPAASALTHTLFAVDPDLGLVREAADLTGRTDPRLLFPASGLWDPVTT